MQYAVFVYVSSAKAVIQDLFLFLFKTKDRERSELDKPREKRAPYYGGKKNQQTKTVSRANTAAKRAVAEYALLGGSDTVFLPFRRENAPGGKAKKKEELLYLCVDFGDVYAEKLA